MKVHVLRKMGETPAYFINIGNIQMFGMFLWVQYAKKVSPICFVTSFSAFELARHAVEFTFKML